MDHPFFPKVGMRKIKSVLALFLSFLIWQIFRIWFPQLDVHPLFGYVYAVIEMRDTAEKTEQFGLRRIKATLIGLTLGLMILPLSVSYGAYAGDSVWNLIADVLLISVGVLLTLSIAELLRCKNFCGVAAIIFVICIVRDRNATTNIYLYAILRVVQTLLGVFSAWLINSFVWRYPSIKKEDGACDIDSKTGDNNEGAPLTH